MEALFSYLDSLDIDQIGPGVFFLIFGGALLLGALLIRLTKILILKTVGTGLITIKKLTEDEAKYISKLVAFASIPVIASGLSFLTPLPGFVPLILLVVGIPAFLIIGIKSFKK